MPSIGPALLPAQPPAWLRPRPRASRWPQASPLPAATAHVVLVNGRTEASVIPAWPRRLAARRARRPAYEPATTGNICAAALSRRHGPSRRGRPRRADGGRRPMSLPEAQRRAGRCRRALRRRDGRRRTPADDRQSRSGQQPRKAAPGLADFRPDRTRIDEIKTYLRSRPRSAASTATGTGSCTWISAARRWRAGGPRRSRRGDCAGGQTVPLQRVCSAAPPRDDQVTMRFD